MFSQRINASISNSDIISEFKILMRENCFLITAIEETYSLTKEQSLIVRDLEKYLSDPSTQAENVNKIIKGLKELCSNEENFKKTLLPTKLDKEGLTITVEQDCLIRLLLKVNVLQNEVIELLLDEVMNAVSANEDNPAWIRLLLNPLRYLPYINKSEELTTKLLDILEISSEPIQLEMLDILPEILPVNRYDQAAKQLVTYLNSKDSLTGAIIDCLGALNLEDAVIMEIQNIILLRILPSYPNNFPVLLTFLLEHKISNNSSVIFKIRDALDSIMSTSNSDEKDNTKVLTFMKLKLLSRTKKQFVQDCLDIISNIKVSHDHKAIDLFLLFLIHLSRNKKRIVETLFRRKIKEGSLKYDLLEKLFKNYMPHQIIKDLFYSIVEVGCYLIRTSEDPIIKLFSESIFKLLFSHKFTEGIYRKEILDNLLMIVSSNEKNHVDQVLDIIFILIKEDIKKFKRHTIIMMRLLEKMDGFDCGTIKKVFEILCSLTCSEECDESVMAIRDEIHMIIRKQLSSSKRNIKFRGIIGAVVMAKYIAQVDSNESENGSAISDSTAIESLPRGKAQDAANLIDMASQRVQGCPEYMGLFYDHLSLTLNGSINFERNYLNWLSEIVLQQFLNTFIEEKFEDTEIDGLVYKPQYCLNQPDEQSAPFMVNIGMMSVKPEQYSNSSILNMASHFRLLRLLIHTRDNGDLTSIDALLGSSVILPEVEDIEDLDHNQLRQAGDCLFHCINWFRELISAFIFHKTVKSKLIQRLKQLVLLESMFNEYLSRIPDHYLPQSYFDSLSQNKQIVIEIKQKKPPAKKAKSKEIVHDDTAVSASVLTAKEKKKTESTSLKSVQEYSVQFREIDTDFYRLLKLKLSFDSNQREGVDIATFTFIMKDLLKKLHTLLLGSKTSSITLKAIRPKDLISDLVTILPHINRNFLIVKEKVEECLKENDSRSDLPEMFIDEVQQLKTCFSLILECYSLVLSWPSLQQSKSMELLKDTLSALRVDDTTLNSISFLVAELIELFASYRDQCLLISQAVCLVKIMKSLYNFSPEKKRKKKIDEACKDLLNRRWYDQKGLLDSGKNFFASVNYLVNAYLDTAKVNYLNDLTESISNECENLKNKNDYLTMLATIDSRNFYILYQGLFTALHNSVKNEVKSLTNTGHLDLWQNVTTTMSNLMSIARTVASKVILCYFLKKSITVLKIFISHGIPIFEIMFPTHMEKVVSIFKGMQSSTRFLHHLCCDSKMKKNVALIPHIPAFRLLLEQLIYKVKALLIANNCQDAFYMGNLKNKDIEGNTQLSEETQDGSEVTENGEDEEMPEDDDDNVEEDETVSDNEERDKSDSDVFD